MKTEEQENSSPKSHKKISQIVRESYSHTISQLIKKRGIPPKHKSFLRKKLQRQGIRGNLDDKIKSSVLVRAREIQAKLSPDLPSMVKYMLKSHVTRGFWLGLPSYFCYQYLPLEDTTMVLEDEKGVEFLAKYLALKAGLSGGWRGFSISHKIMEGDAVIFQLVEPNKFKVYVVRSNCSDELDGCTQMDIDEGGKHRDSETSFKEKVEDRCSQEAPALGNVPMEQNDKNDLTNLEQLSSHSENDIDDHGSDSLDRIMLGKTAVDFKAVRSIEDFTIFANGLIINSHLSKELQAKYYELCTSQKGYLHNHLLEGLNCQLVAGIITETVNIVNSTRAAKLDTPHANFVTWLETLKSFQGLGMNVDFLIATLKKLMKLSSKWLLFEVARSELVKADEERRNLELKLAQVNAKVRRIDMRMKSLDVSGGQGLEQMFREVASGPW